MDFEVSVPFDNVAVETCVEMVNHFTLVCQSVRYAVSHFCNYRKKHQHFGLTYVREGRRFVVNSVKVAVVVSLSHHHQQCDNFHNTQQEDAKWIGTVTLYVELDCLLAP